MAISVLPVLTYLYVRCAPFLEITIFTTACRFLIQTLRKRLNKKAAFAAFLCLTLKPLPAAGAQMLLRGKADLILHLA